MEIDLISSFLVSGWRLILVSIRAIMSCTLALQSETNNSSNAQLVHHCLTKTGSLTEHEITIHNFSEQDQEHYSPIFVKSPHYSLLWSAACELLMCISTSMCLCAICSESFFFVLGYFTCIQQRNGPSLDKYCRFVAQIPTWFR